MASQSWGQVITDIQATGTSYNTFTTQQSILTSGTALASAGFVTLPPGFFRVGGELDFDILLAISSASGQTWTFSIVVGGVNAAVSGIMKVSTTTGTNEPWQINVKTRCLTVGNGTQATLVSGGAIQGRTVFPPGSTPGANYTAGGGNATWQETAPAAGTGFNSTQANTLDFQVTSGTSAAGNQVTLWRYRVVSWGNTAP